MTRLHALTCTSEAQPLLSPPMHRDALWSGRMSNYTKSTSRSVKELLAFWNAHRGGDAF